MSYEFVQLYRLQQQFTPQALYERRQKRRQLESAKRQDLPRFDKIIHPENLLEVFDWMKHDAGRATGPDGLRYEDIGRSEAGALCREISRELTARQWRDFPAREVRIPKASGGERVLRLRSILYRMIATAVKSALEPDLDRCFLEHSMGYRPGRSVWGLLVELQRVMAAENRWVLATDDVERAFDNVRILDLVRRFNHHIQDQQVRWLIEQVLRGDTRHRRELGIDQGSPLSPLGLNLYLHHALDVPFSADANNPPWFRYADNLVYLVQGVDEARQALQQASVLLEAGGLRLKGSEPVVDLRQGKRVQLLGYELGHHDGQLMIGLGKGAWDSLRQNLTRAHQESNPGEQAGQVLRGWIEQAGPAFVNVRERARLDWVRRILKSAADLGFREVGSEVEIGRQVQGSLERWDTFRGNHGRSEDASSLSVPTGSILGDCFDDNRHVPTPQSAPF